MKIDVNKANSLQASSQKQEKACNLFQQALNPLQSKKGGDEYYWYHQQQLEISDLQFKPLKHSKGDQIALDSKQSSAPINTEFQEKTMVKEPAIFKNEKEIKEQIYAPVNYENNLKKEPLLAEKKPSLIALPSGLNQKIKSFLEPANNCLENKAKFHSQVLKEHQLFIHENEAEFSLNTSNLTKQQSEELRLLLKEWLQSKGIKLQQLIINGVKQ